MMYTKLSATIEALSEQRVIGERKDILRPLIDFIRQKVASGLDVNLNFICTHNSRRSHLAQIWAQTLASHFNIRNVYCYSGGTEETALFPMVAEILSDQGFQIATIAETHNPVYAIKYCDNALPIIGFSKKYDSPFNPVSEFAALLTCSQADEGCPFIAGAEKRIPITYEDPKVFDHTSRQVEKYNERSLQIAAELFYVFAQIHS